MWSNLRRWFWRIALIAVVLGAAHETHAAGVLTAAFTASMVAEVRSTGSDSNGGVFDMGVAGFPTDGAATSATGSSPVFSSASYTFVAGDVGAWIFIKAGTNWTPGFYKIASVNAGAATIDASIGNVPLAYRKSDGGYIIYRRNTTTGVATTASPTAATWGIDYSQQNAAQFSFTDMVIGGTTTTFTSAGHPVGKNFIGNSINVTSGTGFTVQRVVVVSTSGTTATCDKALGTAASSGGNGAFGGGLASPGIGCSVTVNVGQIFIKTGSTYSITSTTNNASGGRFTVPFQGKLEAYQTTRADHAARAVIQASGISTTTICSVGGSICMLIGLDIDGASLTSIQGFNGNATFTYNCIARNCTNVGFNGVYALYCRATGCSTQAAFNGTASYYCVADANSFVGFGSASGVAHAVSCCFSINNTGASSSGFAPGGVHVDRCVAYGNGSHGFDLTANPAATVMNCLAVSNTGLGYASSGGPASRYFNLFAYNNTGSNFSFDTSAQANMSWGAGTTTLTGDPFVNAAGGDFRLNAVPGAGAACRAAGLPTDFPGLASTTTSFDAGAAQHRDVFGFLGMDGGLQ